MKYIKGHKQSNTGKTHWVKGHIPWNKGISVSLKPKTGRTIRCIVCSKDKYYQKNELEKRDRKYCSLKCYHLDSRKNNLKYSSVHSRILKDWGKATECEFCGSTKNIDWANISGKYYLKKDDWKQLCRSCHWKYDNKNERS